MDTPEKPAGRLRRAAIAALTVVAWSLRLVFLLAYVVAGIFCFIVLTLVVLNALTGGGILRN